MNQPGAAFFFFHNGQRKPLGTKICGQDLPGGTDRQAKCSRAGDELDSPWRDDAAPWQNRGITSEHRRPWAGRRSEVGILKHKTKTVHYENRRIHPKESLVELIKVGKDPIFGTRFAEESPSVFVINCTWAGSEVRNPSAVDTVDLLSILGASSYE